MKYDWLTVAKRMQAIAQTGITYSQSAYDRERYQELRDLSVKILKDFSDEEQEKISQLFATEKGYQTPKLDVRAVIFRDQTICMVQEKTDGCWTLPGGYCEIGLSPYENAVKEVREETGLVVEAVRLFAVLDKNKHEHPHDAFHAYKLFILCRETGGILQSGMETSDVRFFEIDNLPKLSLPRITESQVEMMFGFLNDPDKTIVCE